MLRHLAIVLALSEITATALHAQTGLTLAGGTGTLGSTASGTVGQIALLLDAPLRGRTRWWTGVHAGRDRDPDWNSPTIRQSVTEFVIAAGPMLPIRGPGASRIMIGAGVYGVALRYGDARRRDDGTLLQDGGYYTGGDWGAVGRAAVQVPITARLSALLDGQWRRPYEGSERPTLRALSVGVRTVW
jgi:hypothetical protein